MPVVEIVITAKGKQLVSKIFVNEFHDVPAVITYEGERLHDAMLRHEMVANPDSRRWDAEKKVTIPNPDHTMKDSRCLN